MKKTEVITQDAIVKSMEKCSALPRYRVGFCFSSMKEAREFYNSIRDIYTSDGIPGIKRMHEFGSSSGQIMFNTDSCIDVFSFNNSIGRRLHDVYWDELIEQRFTDETRDFFNSLLISYHGAPIPQVKHTDWTDMADTSKIDEFLNSFRVVSA